MAAPRLVFGLLCFAGAQALLQGDDATVDLELTEDAREEQFQQDYKDSEGAGVIMDEQRPRLLSRFPGLSKLLGVAPAQGTRYLVFGHHKCGTWLFGSVLTGMALQLHLPKSHVKWLTVAHGLDKGVCPRGTGNRAVVMYEDIRVPYLKHIVNNCTNFRAIHLIREAESQLVSNYVYTKHLYPGMELKTDVEMGKRLRQNSTANGLRLMCRQFLQTYLPQVVNTHKYIQNMTNILEVKYEDFEHTYDATMRRVFNHMLGEGHPKVQALVRLARMSNTNNWIPGAAKMHPHVSSKKEKEEVRQVLNQLKVEGDECMLSLQNYSRQIGYL